MDILGIGYQEILLVLVLALVFLGPERLPEVAYQLGRAVRTMQRYAREVRNEFGDEIAYVDEQYRIMRGELTAVRDEVRVQGSALDAGLRGLTAPPDGLNDSPPQTPVADGEPVGVVDAKGEPTPAPNGPPLVF